jgi:hypothetical protein
MTEAEWLAGVEPAPLLKQVGTALTARKLRLFACACCAGLEKWLPMRALVQAVAIAERLAEGLAFPPEVDPLRLDLARARDSSPITGGWQEALGAAACLLADDILADSGRSVADRSLGNSGWSAAVLARSAEISCRMARAVAAIVEQESGGSKGSARPFERASRRVWEEMAPGFMAEADRAQAALVREVFANPFRQNGVHPAWLAWNDGRVVQLAGALYVDRRFDDLPVLADALEEAGCADADLLSHLRGPGPHVQGCWALDLLLGNG